MSVLLVKTVVEGSVAGASLLSATTEGASIAGGAGSAAWGTTSGGAAIASVSVGAATFSGGAAAIGVVFGGIYIAKSALDFLTTRHNKVVQEKTKKFRDRVATLEIYPEKWEYLQSKNTDQKQTQKEIQGGIQSAQKSRQEKIAACFDIFFERLENNTCYEQNLMSFKNRCSPQFPVGG